MNTNMLYNKYDGKNKSLYTMRRNNIGLTKCIMNLSDYVLYGEPLATKNRLSFHMKMYNSLSYCYRIKYRIHYTNAFSFEYVQFHVMFHICWHPVTLSCS